MDKKTLVKTLRPMFGLLLEKGLEITGVELLPTSLRDYYVLAVSANWQKDWTTMDKIRLLNTTFFESVPFEKRKYVDSVMPFNTPEEMEARFEFFDNYKSDGLCLELFALAPAA
jgi:hypothetical protein